MQLLQGGVRARGGDVHEAVAARLLRPADLEQVQKHYPPGPPVATPRLPSVAGEGHRGRFTGAQALQSDQHAPNLHRHQRPRLQGLGGDAQSVPRRTPCHRGTSSAWPEPAPCRTGGCGLNEGRSLCPTAELSTCSCPETLPLKGPYRAPGDLLLYTMSHQLTASLKTVTEEDDRDHHLLGLLAERRGGGGGVSGLLHHHRPQPQLLRCWCVRARNKRQEPAHRQAFVLFIVVLQPPPAA